MENNSENKSYSGPENRNRISAWLDMIKSYYSDLILFKEKVLAKVTHSEVEEQIKQDVVLNINTMLDKIQVEVIQDLLKHTDDLNTIEDAGQGTESYNWKQETAQRIEQVRDSVGSLKGMILDFLNRKQFGLRHGFKTNYTQ